MSEAPPFWFKKAGIAAWLLSPFGWAWGSVAAKRMSVPARSIADIPVLCVGNFVAGGAGKTPTTMALFHIAHEMGLRPGFLSRGYGGSVTVPTLVNTSHHNARDVGDEPLILATLSPTVVSVDRGAGAELLTAQGVDFIIMDDGLQNPGLHKDLSVAVVDAGRGIGNGFSIPAGPVRANLSAQLAVASAVLLIGKGEGAAKIIRRAARAAKPILIANVSIENGDTFKNRRVLAFSGLGDNQKFFTSLKQAGAEIVETRSFHDHHPYTTEECRELLAHASKEKLILVTTEKDHTRLRKMGGAQELLHAQSHPLHIKLEFENPRMVEGMIEKMMRDARAFRRTQKPVKV